MPERKLSYFAPIPARAIPKPVPQPTGIPSLSSGQQLASPRFNTTIQSLESAFKASSAAGVGASRTATAFKAAQSAVSVSPKGVIGWTAAFLAADFLFNPLGKGIVSDDEEKLAIERAKQKSVLAGLNPGATSTITPATYPFYGGQSDGVLYTIHLVGRRTYSDGSTYYDDIYAQAWGTINSITYGNGYHAQFPPPYGYYGTVFTINCRGSKNGDVIRNSPTTQANYTWYVGDDHTGSRSLISVTVTRADGLPDTGGNPSPTTPEQISIAPNISFDFTPAPEVSAANPSAAPAITSPITLKNPGAKLLPAPAPNVEQPMVLPSSATTNVQQTNETSRTFWSPKPAQVTPSTGVKPDVLEVPITSPIIPIPDRTSPQVRETVQPDRNPVRRVSPIPTPTPTPQNLDPFKDFNKWWTTVGLVTIGTTLSPVYNPQVRQAIETAAKNGTCQSLAGGCSTGANYGQQITSAANNSAAANALLQEAELNLLATMNNKLGAQLPNGGISSFMSRTWDVLQVDRALNVLTFVNTTHNALMLSNALSQTLFSMIGNVLAAVGIKDAEGNALNISSIVGKSIENLFKAVLGTTTVDGIKAEWKKYNRIYQAAANLMFSLQSIGNSILSAAEVIADRVAFIGNALKKFRTVGEKAYNWMNPNVNFQNRFQTAIENTSTAVSQIDSIASEVQSIQQTASQFNTQKTELQNILKEEANTTQGAGQPQAKVQKAQADAEHTASVNPSSIATTDRSKAD